MADVEPKAIVNERQAAILLGITPFELRWFSRMLGLGRQNVSEGSSQIVFTYDELKSLSSAAAASTK